MSKGGRKNAASKARPPVRPTGRTGSLTTGGGRCFLRSVRAIRIAALPVAVTAVVLLFWPLFHKLGTRAVCYADVPGFRDALFGELPGGVLHEAAAFFSVLWRVPWLGGVAFLLLGLGVTALARRWTRLPWAVAPLPFAAVVLQGVYCGFSVWIFVDAAFPCVYLLGWGVVLFLMGAVRRWGAVAFLLTLPFYPLCGTPVLLGCVAAALLPRVSWLSRALGLLSAVLLPVLWQRFVPADPAWDVLLLANAPVLFEAGATLWDVVSAALFLLLVLTPWGAVFMAWGAALASWVAARRSNLLKLTATGLRHRRFSIAGHLCAPVLFLLAVVLMMDPVHPLFDLLACERAFARGDMARILAVPGDRVVAHRMLSAYHIHALWRTGQLEERLFDQPWNVSHAASTIDTMELDGYGLLYGYGIVQLARRWCYESVINKGWSAPKYGLLARIALVCDEPELARRYALQLRRIPLCRAEAETLLALSEKAPGVQPDPDLLRVADLHRRLSADTGSPVFEGSKRLEDGIYNRYAVLKNGNRDMVCLYLCASLLRKDLVPFLENADVILSVWPQRPLPRVFQQALLAAAATKPPAEQPHLTGDLFSPGVPPAFAAFQRLVATANPADPSFRERFARTYWFYSAFVQ